MCVGAPEYDSGLNEPRGLAWRSYTTLNPNLDLETAQTPTLALTQSLYPDPSTFAYSSISKAHGLPEAYMGALRQRASSLATNTFALPS